MDRATLSAVVEEVMMLLHDLPETVLWKLRECTGGDVSLSDANNTATRIQGMIENQNDGTVRFAWSSDLGPSPLKNIILTVRYDHSGYVSLLSGTQRFAPKELAEWLRPWLFPLVV
ncbi:MAG: hypothetical protein ABIP75_00150 [Pyrinomonadaceae bacterium]